MDLPLGTVMSPLYRARVILSIELADLATEHGIDVEESTGTGAGCKNNLLVNSSDAVVRRGLATLSYAEGQCIFV